MVMPHCDQVTYVHIYIYGAYGKAGNGNETEMKQKLETEIGNGSWKQKWEQKTPITGAIFFHSVFSHYSSIPLSNRYGTCFMSHALPLLQFSFHFRFLCPHICD